MTIWIPDLSRYPKPRYLAIARALADDIEQGSLTPGTRLPTHRELAHRLGITVGTVSRGYAEAERRCLIGGQVGRGTFVRGGSEEPDEYHVGVSENRPPDLLDFSLNLSVSGNSGQLLAQVLADLATEGPLDWLLRYVPDIGLARHRAAGARWMGMTGLEASPEQVVVTDGAQHGMAAVFLAIACPGDVVLTEALTFPGMKELASHLDLKLHGLPMDAEGLLPDALADACRTLNPKALYCLPTLQNPTGATMSEARRKEVAEIARAHGILIVEDDVYGFLPTNRLPPLTTFAPEISYYVTSLSKSIAPGLRAGYVRVPEGQTARVGAAVRSTVRKATPLTIEIASRWIDDGTVETFIALQRREAAARYAICRRILPQAADVGTPEGFHLLLPLPEPWRASDFVSQARGRNVGILPAAAFAVGRWQPPHAVRLCLGAVEHHADVERGLQVLADILAEPPRPDLSVI